MASSLTSLRLTDYSDRELLYIVHDLAGPGFAARSDVKDRLGIDSTRANNSIGVRLSYMAGKGWLVREIIEGEPHYALTGNGATIMSGKMAKTAEKVLDKMNPGDLVMLTRYVTGRYRNQDDSMAAAVRREWTRGAYYRRNGS